MFVLPAIILPLVFAAAIYRLFQIPRRILLGELRLPGTKRICLTVATVASYFVLLSYTVALGIAVIRVALVVENQMPACLSLLAYMAAYPFVYVGTAWVFYYGLKPKASSELPKQH